MILVASRGSKSATGGTSAQTRFRSNACHAQPAQLAISEKAARSRKVASSKPECARDADFGATRGATTCEAN